MFLYRNFCTEGRAEEALFNDWLTYALVVLGFYFVFGLAGQFAVEPSGHLRARRVRIGMGDAQP